MSSLSHVDAKCQLRVKFYPVFGDMYCGYYNVLKVVIVRGLRKEHEEDMPVW